MLLCVLPAAECPCRNIFVLLQQIKSALKSWQQIRKTSCQQIVQSDFVFLPKRLLKHYPRCSNILLCSACQEAAASFYLSPSRLCFLTRDWAIKASQRKQTEWLCVFSQSTHDTVLTDELRFCALWINTVSSSNPHTVTENWVDLETLTLPKYAHLGFFCMGMINREECAAGQCGV